MAAYSETPSIRSTVLSVVERLKAWDWRTVVWPAHQWAPSIPRGAPGGAYTAVGVDPTAALLALSGDRAPEQGGRRTMVPGDSWIAETTYFDDYGFDPSTSKPVFALSLGDRSFSAVHAAMSSAYGIIHGNRTSPGWWTPNFCVAALASKIIVPHIDESVQISDPYYLLPSIAEQMDQGTYTAVAQAQRDDLEEQTWQMTQLQHTLHGVLGRTAS